MSELNTYYIPTRSGNSCPCYLKSEADKVIADLEEDHKKEVEMLSTYCREQTEKLCIEMTVVDSLEQNLKKLNRTIWLCRAWAARNLTLYYKLWCERYKDNSNESLASCYLNDSKKMGKFLPQVQSSSGQVQRGGVRWQRLRKQYFNCANVLEKC